MTSRTQCQSGLAISTPPTPPSRRSLLHGRPENPQEAGKGLQPRGSLPDADRAPGRSSESGDGAQRQDQPSPHPLRGTPVEGCAECLRIEASGPSCPRCEVALPPAGSAGAKPTLVLPVPCPSHPCSPRCSGSRCPTRRITRSLAESLCPGRLPQADHIRRLGWEKRGRHGCLVGMPRVGWAAGPTVRSAWAGRWGRPGPALSGPQFPCPHHEDRRLHLPEPL